MPTSKKTVVKRTNSRLKGKQLENDGAWGGPLNYPMNGIFNTFGMGGNAAASQPWEIANNNSYNLISLQYTMLTYAYVIHGPLRTLVDQPVYDAFRGGLKIKSDEVSPEELEDLHKLMKETKVVRKMINALRWDRLFGGAGIIVNTNQDFKKPLNIDSIKETTKIEFIAADRWELSGSGVSYLQGEYFSYYGKTVHISRVAKVIGEDAPSLARQRLQGWGMSVIECVVREISQYFKNNNVIFELLDEAKIDIWKIKGFNSQILSNVAAGKTSRRIQMATMMKNYLNAITLDKEDDYEQKQMTFTGLSDMLEQIRIGIAAAVRMPMAKIFGLAAKGFASGEDDIENYNAIVEGQRDRAEELLDLIIPILMMKQWGYVPDDWKPDWKPLRVLSAEQEENVKTQEFARLSTLYSQGILDPQEYCEVLKQKNILTLETAVSKGQEPEPILMGGDLEEDDISDEGGNAPRHKSAGKKAKKAQV